MEFLVGLGLGFIGGVILNVMPCVLPVLTLKVFKTVQTIGEHPGQARAQSVAYTIGTVLFFMIMAGIVIALRASGEAMGWGMHFRQPIFVAVLCALIFAFGLNSLGVFEFFISSSGEEKDGFFGSIMTGMFAAIMSTPCSAPFLGTAAGFALAANTPWWQTMGLFIAIGFGLAFPFLLLGFIPAVSKIIPRPGAWMDTFKQLMGFTLLGAAVWLYTVLQNQVTTDSAASFLVFLLVLAVGLWAIGKFAGLQHSATRRWAVRFSAIVVVALVSAVFVRFEARSLQKNRIVSTDIVADGHINWVDFDPERIASEKANQRLLFLDFTADWCANCKTNDKLFLETDTVRGALQKHNVLPMKVDMTVENAEMDKWLAKLGRSAIPAYAVVFPDGTFDVLPVAITADLVAGRLAAGAKKNGQ